MNCSFVGACSARKYPFFFICEGIEGKGEIFASKECNAHSLELYEKMFILCIHAQIYLFKYQLNNAMLHFDNVVVVIPKGHSQYLSKVQILIRIVSSRRLHSTIIMQTISFAWSYESVPLLSPRFLVVGAPCVFLASVVAFFWNTGSDACCRSRAPQSA